MSSLGGARLALCVLRSGSLAGPSLLYCFRQYPKRNMLAMAPKGAVQSICSRALSAMAGQRESETWDIDLMDHSNELRIADSSKQFRRFIADPSLARTVVKCLRPWEHGASGPVIFECNPGPGFVTQTLLDAGAKVVALESQTDFLPSLQALKNNADGQLSVVYCDFFKLDPLGHGSMAPPAMYSETLFEDLGINPVPWSADVPVRIFGVFSQRNESNFLWKNIFSIYEKRSIYRYGRIELNMYISEKQYRKLITPPGNMRDYQALSALYQVACDIQLLHMEPWSSFMTPSRFRGMAIPRSVLLPNDHMCLVKFTPRRDLFTEYLTPTSSNMFVIMLKQCLARRKVKLMDRLNSWDPGNGLDLIRAVGLPEDIKTGNITPDQYKLLFEAMEHSESFGKNCLFPEMLENVHCAGV
ncbi:dimethyladenosine transferase 2, mitochondrial [Spea bombifrons]|uniref:dimethyladenosine transferase 2, mitochondrial n=1 Tax=Spea bombifrons TaxID=233779 RepID=UPI00234B1445|nr:dimethyladenosine transferase 2, mitochondrial [Spea bombifrons]XP_053315757.1 dimethyladenosine transferase 2, mitochondrial [Spea bombifrons]